MMVLPSPVALENEALEYFDDYYIDISLSAIEGKMTGNGSKADSTASPAASATVQKEPVATVHLKVPFCFL